MLKQLAEGLTDAVGFVVGSLLGYGLGQLMGLQAARFMRGKGEIGEDR